MAVSESRWLRPTTWTWPFSFGLRLGWTSRIPNPDPSKARGRAYLFRGQGIIFSRGLKTICAELRRSNIWCEDLRCMGDAWACRHILTHAGPGPIIFVGHSCGGRAALYAAKELENVGVKVDLVVCLDVAFPPLVPGNVKKAVNLYLAGPRMYPAHPLQAMDPATIVANIHLGAPSFRLNHLTITSDPQVLGPTMKFIQKTVDSTSADAQSA